MIIKLYQIYYDESQNEYLNKNCEHVYNPPVADLTANMRELPVMLAHEQECMTDNQLTGFISWKFHKKTKINVDTYIENIRSKPGYDVYFKDCGRRRWKSVWLQGEKYHPGIINFTKNIFKKINYDFNINDTSRVKLDAQCFCNFITGNSSFWSKYFNFVKPVVDYINNNLTAEEHATLSSRADKKIDSNLAPFIYERLFSTLLYIDDSIRFYRL